MSQVNEMKLMMDIHKSILENLRGGAEPRRKELEFKLVDVARRFVIEVAEFLDNEVSNDQDRAVRQDS